MHKYINSYENHLCGKRFLRKMCKHSCIVLETRYTFSNIFTPFCLWPFWLGCYYKQTFSILPGKYLPGKHRDPRKRWKTRLEWDRSREGAGLGLASNCADVSATVSPCEQKKPSHRKRPKIRPKLRSKEAMKDLPLIQSPSRQIDTGRFWFFESCSSHLTFKETR